MLLPKIQRTKVESKSQLLDSWWKILLCCYQKYKEQKLKANHNVDIKVSTNFYVVTKNTKNKSWKQITTVTTSLPPAMVLLPKIHRTKVESKSQQISLIMSKILGCYQKYKEQKLKANHNYWLFLFTYFLLLPKIQRTKVESKSQHCPRCRTTFTVVTKNTKNKSWKQITTPSGMYSYTVTLLPKIQRTKVESKSQL